MRCVREWRLSGNHEGQESTRWFYNFNIFHATVINYMSSSTVKGLVQTYRGFVVSKKLRKFPALTLKNFHHSTQFLTRQVVLVFSVRKKFCLLTIFPGDLFSLLLLLRVKNGVFFSQLYEEPNIFEQSCESWQLLFRMLSVAQTTQQTKVKCNIRLKIAGRVNPCFIDSQYASSTVQYRTTLCEPGMHITI